MKSRLFKVLCVVLALSMLIPAASLVSGAAGEDYCPSIVIPGVFQSDVNLYDKDGNIAVNSDGKPYSKPFFLDSTADIVFEAATSALIPISKMLIKQKDKDHLAAQAIAEVAGKALLGKVLSFDEDGNPVYDIRATKYGSVASCSAEDRAYIYNQIPLREYTNIVGEENLYFFSYNSFGNIMDIAAELYEYIQTVKSETGSDKVNIVPISQGGTLANALLEMYPDVVNDLNRIVYIVPALDGTCLIGDLFTTGLVDDDVAIYHDLFPSLLGEDSEWLGYLINFILRIMPNADLNAILDEVVNVIIGDYTKYSTCMWALVPSGTYEQAAANYLSSDEDAELKAQTDWYYQAQLNSDANILAAIDAGVEVFDLVDYNCALYNIVDSADECNGDGIIQVDSTSMGATSYGVDVQLPDDYVSVGSKCSDASHNHIDPYNIIDASTGLLPEQTFYFYNQNHERTASNDVIIKLATKLLTDESFVDIYSYPDEFPQFNIGRTTKGLINSVNAMRYYDRSSLSAEDAAELDASIAEIDAIISNTVVTEESNAALADAQARFYAIRDKINGVEVDEKEQQKETFLGKLKAFFTIILRFFSDLFYRVFGGGGFSDI